METILHVACDKGDINPSKGKLLEAGADPNVTMRFGFTPLMRAVQVWYLTTNMLLSVTMLFVTATAM